MTSHLQFHATAALAAKLGGFDQASPQSEVEPLILDTWYANIVRRRKPRVLAMNTQTLMTVIVPLAPARDFFTRFPAYVAMQLDIFNVPHDFIHAHVDRIAGRGTVVKTADKRMLGVLNRRMIELEHFRLDTEGDWLAAAEWFTTTITLALGEPHHGAERLFGSVQEWERTGVARVDPAVR